MLPIGGPGRALTAKAQADMLFRITGNKENTLQVPVALMDGIIGILDFFAKFFPAQFEVRSPWVPCVMACVFARLTGLWPPRTCSQDAAEFGRIGKYYAVESMLVWDPVKQV